MLFQCYYSTGYSRREGHGEDPPAGGAATQRQGEAARRGETTSRAEGTSSGDVFRTANGKTMDKSREIPWKIPGISRVFWT